ncbi:GNAT family N-acetyltransferase [Lachnospiraceae bacterium 62-35]
MDMNENIRYLEDREKLRSRNLWEEAFHEDSKEFCDYYFHEKIKNNRILVKEEKGEILSMIHLNPYEIRIKNKQYCLDFIVGVATVEGRRHEGHMKSLLIEMMKDMYRAKVPFTFLMPASEAIYYPFDFRFICGIPKWKSIDFQEQIQTEAGWTEIEPEPKGDKLVNRHPDASEIAEWMNQWLKKRYQVHTIRSEAYVKRLDKELASEKGVWTFLYREDSLAGIHCIWGPGEQRLLYEAGTDRKKMIEVKPGFMGRVICLEEFVKNIGLKQEVDLERIEVKLGILDSLIPENQGLWQWRLDKAGSVIEKISTRVPTAEGRESGYPVFTIGELIEWLSGYKTFEIEGLLSMVQPLEGVFFDEVV